MRALMGFVLIIGMCISVSAQTSTEVMTPFGQQRGNSGNPPGQNVQRADGTGQPANLAFSSCGTCPTRVFSIRYVAVSSIVNLLKSFEVPYSVEPALKAISVKASDKTLDAIDEMIKRFDIPANTPKQVEVTAYLLLGSPQMEQETVPAILKPVLDQLRNVMTYKSYRVLDTVVVTGKDSDSVQESGITPKIGDTDQGYMFQFGTSPHVSGEGAERYVHFDNLHLGLSGIGDLRTSVDVKKGQQVVIGKTTIKDHAVILVLSAKIID